MKMVEDFIGMSTKSPQEIDNKQLEPNGEDPSTPYRDALYDLFYRNQEISEDMKESLKEVFDLIGEIDKLKNGYNGLRLRLWAWPNSKKDISNFMENFKRDFSYYIENLKKQYADYTKKHGTNPGNLIEDNKPIDIDYILETYQNLFERWGEWWRTDRNYMKGQYNPNLLKQKLV